MELGDLLALLALGTLAFLCLIGVVYAWIVDLFIGKE